MIWGDHRDGRKPFGGVWVLETFIWQELPECNYGVFVLDVVLSECSSPPLGIESEGTSIMEPHDLPPPILYSRGASRATPSETRSAL